MKKQNLYLLLLSILAGCTDIDTPHIATGDSNYQVTACIRSISCAPRVNDGKTQSTFQTGDKILIGWEGNASAYGYTYSGSDGIFTPSDENSKSLWSKLIEKGTGKVEVYAWYDPASASGTLPADNSTLSVKSDQSTEKDYLSGLYMAAHQQVEGTAKTLDFTFRHLVSRIRLSIDFNDKSIEEADIQDAVVKMRLYASATIKKGTASKDYQLTVSSSLPGPTDDITLFTTTEPGSSHLECICLIPPQSLDEKNSITIVLGKGKEYTCTLGKSLALSAGQEVALSIEITTEGTDVHAPVVTVVPETSNCSYSGNRLITGNTDGTVSIYEKQADGSWGVPSKVYESLESDNLFQLTDDYYVQAIDLYKNYAGWCAMKKGMILSSTNDRVYFCKRQKGKWYVSNTLLNTPCYSLVLNKDFLVYGPEGGPDATAVPISENGEYLIENRKVLPGFSGFKLCIAENNVLCNGNVLAKVRLGADKKPTIDKIQTFNSYRAFTDGKRIITQMDKAAITIYNIEAKKFETIENPIEAGVGRPVVIYENYALAGEAAELVLYYFDGSKWIRLGDQNDKNSFLAILQKYAPDESINDLTYLVGTNLMMKSTRVTIVSNSITYFVENIDELVRRWLEDNPQ